jgi:hypothetical protein
MGYSGLGENTKSCYGPFKFDLVVKMENIHQGHSWAHKIEEEERGRNVQTAKSKGKRQMCRQERAYDAMCGLIRVPPLLAAAKLMECVSKRTVLPAEMAAS